MEDLGFFTLSYASGAFILMIITGFLAYLSRLKYLIIWALYWFVLNIGYLSLYNYYQTDSGFYSGQYVLMVIIGSCLFVYGVYALLHKPFSRKHVFIVIGIMVVLTIANIVIQSEMLRAMIQSILLSGFFFWGSIMFFLRQRKLYYVLGVLSIILAVNYMFFPVIYTYSWYIPFGFIIVGIIGMLFGLGIIAHYLIDVKEDYIDIQRKLTYMSYHDALTSVYNRAYLDEQIEYHNKQNTYPFSMIVLDLNDFKKTNDKLGHRKGDEILVLLSNILQSATSLDDKIIRYGGDEFIVLLPNKTRENAELLTNNIKSFVKKAVTEDYVLSVAIGFATKEQKQEPLMVVFDRAEVNMYKNKNAI